VWVLEERAVDSPALVQGGSKREGVLRYFLIFGVLEVGKIKK